MIRRRNRIPAGDDSSESPVSPLYTLIFNICLFTYLLLLMYHSCLLSCKVFRKNSGHCSKRFYSNLFPLSLPLALLVLLVLLVFIIFRMHFCISVLSLRKNVSECFPVRSILQIFWWVHHLVFRHSCLHSLKTILRTLRVWIFFSPTTTCV